MQQVIIESRRRRWPWDVKRRIVEETLEPNVTVSEVARRHDIPASQLFAWRKALRQKQGGEGCHFIPLSVDAGLPLTSSPQVSDRTGIPAERIEIVLMNGRRLSVPLSIDARRLGKLAKVLDGQ